MNKSSSAAILAMSFEYEREREREMARAEEGTEGQISIFDEKMRRAQKAARIEHWAVFKKIFEGDKKRLLEPFDLFGNTAIHIVTRSENPQLLQELLEMLPEADRWHALRKGNCVNNTLLHEIIFCTTVEMAGVVFKFEMNLQPPPEEPEEKQRPLVELINDSGETPLFRAAKLGKLKMLKYMAKHVDGDIRRHFVRFDKCSILHASILGQFFDVAIWLLSKDERLAQHKDMSGLTCLQLLSNMQLVFQSQAPSLGTLKNLIYCCTSLSPYSIFPYCVELHSQQHSSFLSLYSTICMGLRLVFIDYNLADTVLPEEGYEIDDDDDDDAGSVEFTQRRDLESGQQDKAKLPSAGISRINYAVWRTLAREFNGIGRIWQEKKHKLAEHLAEMLVQKDLSWQISCHENQQPLIVLPILSSKSDRIKQIQLMKEKRETNVEISHSESSYTPLLMAVTVEIPRSKHYTPLLTAAGSGIVEIVEKIIDMNPEAVCHVSEDEHNVLHMAVKHRQLKIFKMIRRNGAFKSLISRITEEGRTLLHQVSRMEFYKEQHLPGVAFQLQDELRWYERVRKIVPPHYLMHCDKDGLTAGDVLEMEHQEMHKEAKCWIKETAQSCSTVAVLVATVVFAAVYTIPGGTEKGIPVFLGSPVFYIFTVMDVMVLTSSLGSVVTFLSILTSPFELWDFHKSLPRKLNLGFAFLFFSLVCTTLAFNSTIFLTIKFENQNWASILCYSAAFLPVAIFGWMQFPLCKMVERLVKRLFETCKQVVPTTFIEYFKKRAQIRNYQITKD